MRWTALFVAGLLATPAAALVEDVPMRDGVLLKTHVSLPGDDATTPRGVILMRTPYGAAATQNLQLFDLLRPDREVINQRGWVYVTQDLRGTGESEGGPTARFLADSADTDDTLDWIAAQPWSNGKVAMWGVSAPAIVSLLAIQRQHPALVGVLAIVATGDIHEAFYPGGALREEMAAGWLPDNAGAGILELYRAHEERDDFWDEGVLSDDEIEGSSVKTLIAGGAFDVFNTGAADTHRRLVALSDNPDEHLFVLGPWAHDSVAPSRQADLAGALQGELKFPLSAFLFPGQPLDPNNEFFPFMSWALDDGPAPNRPAARAYRWFLNDEPEVLTNLRANGGFVGFDAWPPAEAAETALLLYDDGAMGTADNPGGVPLRVTADPADPIPTTGGQLLFSGDGVIAGPRNERALLEARDDLLLFETLPATAQVHVVGDLRAEIFAASADTDIDVHVKVYLKSRSGEYFLLTDGVRRGRYAGGLDEILPLTPAEPARFEVALGPQAFLLRPGQALAVAVQGSNAGRFDVNPNTAVPLRDAPTPREAVLSVYTDPDHPSRIFLPITEGEIPPAPPPETHPDPGPDPVNPLDPPPGGGGPPAGCGCGAITPGVPDPGVAGVLALFAAGVLARRRRSRR